MAKILSVHQPWRLRKYKCFLSFSYYNFEDAVTYVNKDMFKKKLSVVQILISK